VRHRSLQHQGSLICPPRMPLALLLIVAVAAGCTEQKLASSSEKSLNDQGIELIQLGQYNKAEPILLQALATRERAFGSNHPNVSYALYNIGWLYRSEGRYAEAEPLIRRALFIQEKSLGPESKVLATTLNELGYVLLAQGRYAEAEPLFRRALSIQERHFDQNDPALAITFTNIGYLYFVQGNYKDARPLYERALSIREQALGPDHPEVALVLTDIGVIDQLQGRFAEAEALEQRALAIRQKTLGPEHPNVADSFHDLGNLYQSERRFPESELALKRGIAIEEKALGPDHPLVAMKGLASLAQLYQTEGNLGAALEASDRARDILEHQLIREAAQKSSASITERRRYRDVFLDNVALTYAAAHASGPDPAARSIGAAQYAAASTAGQALAAMAARFATEDTALASSIRRLQDLADRRQQLDAALLKSASEPTTARDEAAEAALRASLEATDRDVTALAAKVAHDFPAYADIMSPKALPLSTIQTLLAPDEAMLVYLIGSDTSWLWVIRSDTAQLHKLDMSAAELAGEVTALRALLDPDDNPALNPFPARRAYALYRRIMAPAGPLLQGIRNLVVVPDGALQSLPFGVLVTHAPSRDPVNLADHRNVHWLARDHAVTVLPSIASLHALRAFAQVSHASSPFLGVGDPALGGWQGNDRSKPRGVLADLGPVMAERPSVPWLRSVHDPEATARAVEALQPLPETAVELRTIAQILGASEQNLLLGPQATEPALEHARLDRYRVVEFATHGLMPGNLGLNEPALVLTPTHQAHAEHDGLLTASKIVTLKFDADWVILSACNTAASDAGPDPNGFSALAKAFFYAGARSVLMSHWSVPSESTVKLTTGAIAELAKAPAIGRAEALRRSMMAMLDPSNPPAFAHPLVWAPFSLAGEGRTEMVPEIQLSRTLRGSCCQKNASTQ
jgi:CHAT domain-containing protein/Tfp pilus assembly protein PilF